MSDVRAAASGLPASSVLDESALTLAIGQSMKTEPTAGADAASPLRRANPFQREPHR
ncbi:MAG: hypothetical protein U5O16_30170 [Rhodococcus sp. (in: high G+C Gram-positive bacteria)]|uniref:hypothetical protein n=1 Tax=Rhodococcus sp. TaxID=1831 RepID=UPI002AD68140|nr:hypothetical protein [Rhodococcus sp. (in: high G+C Gram-positive bacteria)]